MAARKYRHADAGVAELEAEKMAALERESEKAAAEEAAEELETQGVPLEFQSLAITIDHLLKTPTETGEYAVKFVYSNFPVADALLNQIDYFIRNNETKSNPLRLKSNILTLAKAADKEDAVYIYTPSPRLTNVMVSLDTFLNFAAEEGSLYGAVSALVALAMGMELTYKKKGIDTELMVTWPDDA